MGVGWLDRVHPEDRDRVPAARQYAASPIPVFYIDYRIQHRRQDRLGRGVLHRADGRRHLQGPHRHDHGHHRRQEHFPDEDCGSG